MIENKVAVEGIIQILDKLSDEELFNLSSTVTQGFLKNKLANREDAYGAIIKYSPSAISILKRKLVTRDCLFYYIHKIGVDVKLPITKDALITQILKLWVCNDEEAKTEIAASHNTVTAKFELDIMAQKFTEWFYQLTNQNDVMGSEHFFPDATLLIKLINNDQSCIEYVENNADHIVKLLFKIKQEHQLYFNPNLTKNGLQGKMDPHGLVIIMVCGSLHINSIIGGVFEQMFALARDPFSDNNWKIKKSLLTLRSKSNVDEQPCLSDGDPITLLEIE